MGLAEWSIDYKAKMDYHAEMLFLLFSSFEFSNLTNQIILNAEKRQFTIP